MKSEFSKQQFLKELVDDIILQMKDGEIKQYGSYIYRDDEFREGSRIVEEREVRDYIYQYCKSGTITFFS